MTRIYTCYITVSTFKEIFSAKILIEDSQGDSVGGEFGLGVDFTFDPIRVNLIIMDPQVSLYKSSIYTFNVLFCSFTAGTHGVPSFIYHRANNCQGKAGQLRPGLRGIASRLAHTMHGISQDCKGLKV
jgi:hypothetical protein